MNGVAIDRNYATYSPHRRAERKAEPANERSRYCSMPSQQRSGRKPSLTTLIAILEQEIALHEELLNKKREERPCLATGAVTELQKITGQLSALVERIRELEDRRREEMAHWAEFLGNSSSKITLRMIAHRLSPDKAERLIQVGDRLKALVIAVRDENNMNEMLLRRSLRLVNEEIRILTGEEDNVAYTSGGMVTHKQPPSRSRLVDCRV